MGRECNFFNQANLARHLVLVLIVQICFLFIGATAFAITSVSLSKTTVTVGDTTTASWSGFSGAVNVYLYKGGVKKADVITNTTNTSQNLNTTNWDVLWGIGNDYSVKVEQRSNTAIYNFSGNFSLVRPVLIAPQLTSPTNGGSASVSGVPGTVSFQWQTVSGASGYTLMIDTNPVEINNGSQTTYNGTISGLGAHQWKACTKNSSGVCGSWSSINIFTVTENTLSAPSLTSPANGGSASVPSVPGTVSFQWQTVSGASGYTLMIDTNPVEINNGSQTTYNGTISGLGAHQWKACTKNASGICGLYTQTANFTVSLSLLNPPSLTSPINGNSVIVSTNPGTVPLRWSASGSYGYKIQIDNLSEMDMSSNQYDASLGIGAHTWQVCTKNASGVCGSYSSLANFSAVLSGVTLISPTNNSSVNDKVLTLSWSAISGATYELVVDNASDYSSPEINEAGLTTTTRTFTNHLPNGTYYWKVRAKFADNSTTAWASGQFTYNLPVYVAPVWVPLYRLFKSSTKDHYYTTSPTQRDSAVTNSYTFEKIEGYISDRKFDDPKCGYLFRLYKDSTSENFYTSSETEKDNRITAGYSYKGIAGFIYTSSVEGLVPFYYLSKDTNTDNFYTISKDEYQYAQTTYGFVDHGSIGYVSPAGLKNASLQNRPQGNFAGIDAASGAYRMFASTDLSIKSAPGLPMSFTRTYNSNNFATLPLGQGWSHSLTSYVLEDILGNVFVKWGDGTETFFTKNGVAYIPENGSFDSLERVDDGSNKGYNLTTKNQTVYKFREFSVSVPDGSPWRPSVLLCYIVDKYGNEQTFSYNAASGLLYRAYDSLTGRSLNIDYNASSLINKVSDSALNRSVFFTYDSNGRLLTVVDTRGNVTSYQYTSDGFLNGVTYPEGNQISVTYDAQQRVTGYSSAGVSYSVDFTNGTRFSGAQGALTYLHDTSGRMTSVSDSVNAGTVGVSYYSGSKMNLPQTVTDRSSNATSFVYDDRGNVISSTNAYSQVTSFIYDTNNNLLSSTDPRMNTTNYSYLNMKTLTSVTAPTGGLYSFTYNSNGLVSSMTEPNGRTINYTYDSSWNLTRVTDSVLGAYEEYTYDAAGRMLSKKDMLGRTTNFSYDANDSMVSLHTSVGTATFTYDRNNRLTNVKDPLGQSTGASTAYIYNAMNVVSSETSPDGKTISYGYDNRGNLVTVTDPDNNVYAYIYDAINRLTEMKYNNTTKLSYPEYDANGNIKRMVDENGTSYFTYDNLGRLSAYQDAFGKTVNYEYDASGNRSKVTYPGTKVVDYTYDGSNRLVKVHDWLGGDTNYSYNNMNQVVKVQNPNGTYSDFTYDSANRLTGLANRKPGGGSISDYSYVFDLVGNPTQITMNEPLTPTISAMDVTYTYDSANKLLSSGGVTYSYDNRGNLVSTSNGKSLAYDYGNRLIQATVSGSTVSNVYDGAGNRIARTAGGVQTRYVLDINGQMSDVLMETDQFGTVKNYYVYGLGLIERIDASGNRSVYHYNNIGSTIAITNSVGNITDSYAYDEFGAVLSMNETTANPFRYVGQFGVMDEGNGLLFMRARHYDPETGRFISKDPIGFAGGDLNLYGYVGGNPVTGIDPKGLCAWHHINPCAVWTHMDLPPNVRSFFNKAVVYAGKHGFSAEHHEYIQLINKIFADYFKGIKFKDITLDDAKAFYKQVLNNPRAVELNEIMIKKGGANLRSFNLFLNKLGSFKFGMIIPDKCKSLEHYLYTFGTCEGGVLN